jgi:hypothetical protein
MQKTTSFGGHCCNHTPAVRQATFLFIYPNVIYIYSLPHLYFVCSHFILRSIIILLQVHPLPGNALVIKFPRRQILGKQSVARFVDEAVFSMRSLPSKCRITGLCNPFLSNGWVNTFPHIGPC